MQFVYNDSGRGARTAARHCKRRRKGREACTTCHMDECGATIRIGIGRSLWRIELMSKVSTWNIWVLNAADRRDRISRGEREYLCTPFIYKGPLCTPSLKFIGAVPQLHPSHLELYRHVKGFESTECLPLSLADIVISKLPSSFAGQFIEIAREWESWTKYVDTMEIVCFLV